MRENTDQNNSEYEHLLRSGHVRRISLRIYVTKKTLANIVTHEICREHAIIPDSLVFLKIFKSNSFFSASIFLRYCHFVPLNPFTDVFQKMVFMKISQYSQKNTCVGVSFSNKLY